MTHAFQRKHQFSRAGLYGRWRNPDKGEYVYIYTVLATEANPMISEIHNNAMIIPHDHEKDWLSRSLGKNDVDAFYMSFDENKRQHIPSRN